MADEPVKDPSSDTVHEPDSLNDAGETPAPNPSLSSQPSRRHSAVPELPQSPKDESRVGWGDDPAEYSDDWYRRERPPHHG
jgi:hypothetical protein